MGLGLFMSMSIKLSKLSYKLLVLMVGLFLVFTSLAYQNKVFSQHFVDEEDNIVLGKYLLRGEKLYSDLFSHHQPLAYIISAGVQKLTNPNSIYLLIKRHREFIILWSFVYSMVILLRFGPVALFIVPFELVKFFLFGNLFLSESLATYPFIYLILLMFDKEIGNWDLVFAGLCLSVVVLLLSPLWLAILLIIGVLILQRKVGLKNILWVIAGALPVVIVCLFFISTTDYFHNAFYINFKYYIPMTQREELVTSLSRGFAAPFLSFFSSVKASQILLITQVLSLLLILNSVLLVRLKRWRETLLIFSVLGVSNARFLEGGLQYYSGFHTLPWFAGLLTLTSYTSVLVWRNYSEFLIRALVMILAVVVLGLSMVSSKDGLFTKRDLDKDFDINYSRQFTFGEAVRIMKSDKDTLMVVPDEWLLYWQGDLPHRTKMVNYYAWMSGVPELRGIVENSFKKDPPEFFYCDCVGHYFGLEKYWDQYYVMKKDGKETKLMVLKTKLNTLTKDQLDQLRYHNFDTIVGND